MGKENTEIKDDFKVYFPTGKDIVMAAKVSGWTKKYGNMLPKSTEEILVFFEKGNAIIIRNKQDVLMSHAAVTFAYQDGWKEIGAVVTDENFRKIGAASTAVRELIRMVISVNPASKLFALANPMSAKLFEKLGAKKMLSTQLPSEVWNPCKTCPNYKMPKEGTIFQCCDTPYDLTNIIT